MRGLSPLLSGSYANTYRSVSTMRRLPPSHEMGVRAMRMLLQTMARDSQQGFAGNESVVVFDAELRVRESTGPPRSRVGPDLCEARIPAGEAAD